MPRRPERDPFEESMLEILNAEQRWEDALTAAWTYARGALPAIREQLAHLRASAVQLRNDGDASRRREIRRLEQAAAMLRRALELAEHP